MERHGEIERLPRVSTPGSIGGVWEYIAAASKAINTKVRIPIFATEAPENSNPLFLGDLCGNSFRKN